MPEYLYFSVLWAVREHDQIIQKTGGLEGVPKKGELEGLLEFIKDDGYYPEFEDKLTHLVFSLIKNHYFADGNKRSSIAIGAYFLKVNGYGAIVDSFIPGMENVVLCVADDIILKQQLEGILRDLIVDGEISEANKVLIINGIEEYQRREEARKTGRS